MTSIQLINAILADDASRIRTLSAQGANLNDMEGGHFPPLLKAVMCGKVKAIQALIDCGADKNAVDKQGRTALDWATQCNQQQIIDILRQN